ncbi:glycosyltransferase family 9 protein [Caenimonas sp. SL110]|uniref:glycosyltransferase family 9 protein n=1 Tax=Caenimonas sp. SL110 TaxID=1450524 RepID=UPI00069F7503|nr:glycosyltransferase family 9 protein [Caenimonas sp. SL110]
MSAVEATGGIRIWHSWVSFALASLGFFLPFSSAGVAISMGVLLALAAMRPRQLIRAAPWRDPVMATGLILFAFIALHTLVMSAIDGATFGAINRYHELLFAPLLVAMLQDARHRQILVHGLMAGCAFLAALYWIGIYVPALGTFLGTRRISAGFALATCAFILVMRARGRPGPWPARGLAAILALTVLYAIDGRTGHLVLLALVSVAAWLHSPRRWRGVVTLAAFVVALGLAMSSDAVGNRLKEGIAGASSASAEGITSTGIRIELMRVAGDLARTHALAGAGYANYAGEHEKAAQARYRTPVDHVNAIWMRSTNPHNEFLMHLISGGVIALALFVAWLALTLRAAARARPGIGALMTGLVLAFIIGSAFNSLLLDFVEGHIYMALLAWVIAENRYACAQDKRTAELKSVLVIATRQIGDVLLTTPLIEAVRTRWPDARVDVLGFAGTLGMLRANPAINGFIETRPRAGFQGARALIRQIWRRYDLALVTDPGDRAHLLGWIAAPCRSGIIPAHGGSNWLKREILDHVVEAAGDLGTTHVAVEKLSLIEPWLAAGTTAVPRVVPPPGSPLPAWVDAALKPGAVVVHAPSMWNYKQWPIAKFDELIRALIAQGRQVVLTGSGGDRDQECIAPLRAIAPAPQLLDTSGQLDFNQLVTLFARAALYIGPDTSVSHLAAATGIPVIAIFGPTNPVRWAPWPAKAEAASLFQKVAAEQRVGNVTLMQGSQPCVPCGKAGCEDHRQSRSDCLMEISAQRVMEQARELLSLRA